MSIRSFKDINDAYDVGRNYSALVTKGATSSGFDSTWYDWSFTTGHPIYDARLGPALAFEQYVNTANQSVWFPAISASHTRYLAGMDMRFALASTGQVGQTHMLYDLLGVYSLIDGDSTDVQTMDNASTLPRYTSGVGVRATMINHISPTFQSGDGTLVYIDDTDTQRTVSFRVGLFAINSVGLTGAAGSVNARGYPWFPLASGSKGVKSIVSLTFTTPPSGIWTIMLCYPLHYQSRWIDPLTLNVNSPWTEFCMCYDNAFKMPIIYDGAALNFLSCCTGGSRGVGTYFGQLNFIWG
jgi:hypothetical protein